MNWKDLGRFYLGRREAIEQVATTKYLFWVSCLFIVSAGLARNYDHHLLLEEPMWITGPFGMAFFSSFLIFGFLRLVCRIPLAPETHRFANYTAWMRCFFLTAPLAWLYGIPYESFMPILPATQLNFATLLVVSIWRVYLMGQTARTLYKLPTVVAYSAMLIPASLEMMFGGVNKTLNLVGIMGGMRLSESDQFLVDATSFVVVVSFWLAVVSLIVFLIFTKKSKGRGYQEKVSGKMPHRILTVAGISVLVWLGAATIYQPKLSNMKALRTAIHSKDLDLAVELLQQTPESDYPPGHDIFSRYYSNLNSKQALLAREAELPPWAVERLTKDVEALSNDPH